MLENGIGYFFCAALKKASKSIYKGATTSAQKQKTTAISDCGKSLHISQKLKHNITFFT